MGTGTRLLVIEGQVIHEGTSLFHNPSNEVAWVTGRGSESIHVETVANSFDIPVEAFERRVRDGTIVVESQPPASTVG